MARRSKPEMDPEPEDTLSPAEQIKREREAAYQQTTPLKTGWGEGSSYITFDNQGRRIFWYAIDAGTTKEGKRRRVHGRSMRTFGEAYRRCLRNLDKVKQEGLDAPGRQRRKTKRDARKELADLTVNEYFTYYMEQLGTSLSESQKAKYRGHFKNHISAALGELRMWQVDRSDVRTFYRSTLPKKRKKVRNDAGELVETDEPLLTEAAIRNIHRPLKKMFDFAVEEDRLLHESPVLERYAPKVSDIEAPSDLDTVLEKTRIALHLLDMAREQEDAMTELWLRLNFWGLRQGERNGLQWSSVLNLDTPHSAILRVDHQFLYEQGSGFVLKPQTKTRYSRRQFPISEGLRQAFLRARELQNGWKQQASWSPVRKLEDLVLTSPTGKPFRQQIDTKKWHAFRRKWMDADNPEHAPHIDNWRQHLNRHITATLLYTQGVDIESAMRIIGHGDKEMARYYRAMTANQLRPSIDVLDELYEMPAEQREQKLAVARKGLSEASSEFADRAQSVEYWDELLKKEARIEAEQNLREFEERIADLG